MRSGRRSEALSTCARPDMVPSSSSYSAITVYDEPERRPCKSEGARSIGRRDDGLPTGGASHGKANLDVRHRFAAFVINSARDP